jgi:hypothetical protein
LLAAIHATSINANIYQAIIAVGLDIDAHSFQANVQMLADRGAYYGRINLQTGEKDQYTLGKVLEFKPGFLEGYFELTSKVLAYDAKDLKSPEKMISHTGTVTYHALKVSTHSDINHSYLLLGKLWSSKNFCALGASDEWCKGSSCQARTQLDVFL